MLIPAHSEAHRTGLEYIRPGLRVALALSGGVDSREAGRRLLEAGAEVAAFHLRLFDGPDQVAAAAAARDLRLSLEVVDFRAHFQRLIIQPFIDSYLQGLTPNPCALCNPLIKFGLFMDLVRERGCRYLATGHYAALAPDSPRLRRARDQVKDQSYFLGRLTPAQLAGVIWPLAGSLKEEVRQRDREAGSEPPPDSQDICFLSGDYRDFLRSRLGSDLERPGDFVNAAGRRLGRHRGLAYYTVGQRRGLGLPAAQPYYVLALRPEENQVVLGFRKELAGRSLMILDPELAEPGLDAAPFRAEVRLRYRHQAAPALITPLPAGTLRVDFDQPQSAVTPGQAVVIYRGDLVLGSGWCGRPEP